MVTETTVMNDMVELDCSVVPLPQPAFLLLNRHFRLDRGDEIPMGFRSSKRRGTAIEEVIESFGRFPIRPRKRHVLDRKIRPGDEVMCDCCVASFTPNTGIGRVIVLACRVIVGK